MTWRFADFAVFFGWHWQWGFIRMPSPFLPYEWCLYLGPIALARVTTRKPWKLTRQQKRAMKRKAMKAVKRAERRARRVA